MEIAPSASERMNGSKHISDDIKSLAASLRRELESLQTLSGRNSVCRVPERIRQSNEKAYTLQIVSTGPFHHGRTELKPMEEYKRRYCNVSFNELSVSFHGDERISMLRIVHKFSIEGMEENLEEEKYSRVEHLVDFLRT
ncbi:hypothetical protein OWV82_003224 [Melia azedarach]|uniref:Uncharacterized protein n=1 Tax=Melia azedarach TaxID=155640 RepID=A0ACC1YME5_MELAZ|nr:hypothetical protein OWV82_003224 [Melia azedarach]